MEEERPINIYLSHRVDDPKVYELVDKLCAAFETEGLTTFEQDQDLETEDSLPDYLLKPIHEAWVYIFFFCKKDATSRGHLMELKEITWRIHRPRGVILIFYDLDVIQAWQVQGEVNDNVTSRFSHFTSRTPNDLFELYSVIIQPRRISKAIKEIVSDVMKALRQLERIPNRQIMEVLKKSYDELDDECKEIFLDITCFFIGKKLDRVKEILDSYGFPNAENGIKLLIKKSLVETSSDHIIEMHKMLQEMGRHIVRRGSPYDPIKWSRVWHLDDIDYVMQQNESTVMERLEAISLDLEDSRRVTLRIEALSHMKNLRLLIFHNVNFSGTLNSLSNELRYVSWHQYPFTSLPSSFEPQALVELILLDSNIKDLWEGKKVLPKLKILKLSGSKNLIKMPNLGGIPNLERLELEGCTGLLQLHPSIAKIPKLKFLNLRNCINLVSIPNMLFGQRCLEFLNLAGCSKFASRLRFYPLRSTAEVKLLSIWYHPFLERMLYCFLFDCFAPE